MSQTDKIDRDKLIVMALIHNIADFRPWDGTQKKKQLNIDYLACDLSPDTAQKVKDYWTEYWDKKTPEAQLAHEICAFEHIIALDEDGIPGVNFTQYVISSPELQNWMKFLDASKKELTELQNAASFGSSYWNNPQENMRILDNVMSKDNLAESPLLLIRMLRDMSSIKRKGWIKRGMDSSVVESDASHSWRVALICFLFSPESETLRSTKLSLIHDLGEIVMGDVTPSDGIAQEMKHRHERFGQKFLVHVSPAGTMNSYFAEFESCQSVAAQITHEVDSLECRVQAVEYILKYPQFEKLFEFLEDETDAVYFHNLTNLLSKEEVSLHRKQSRQKQSELTIIFVTGGPGVGKDTQCSRLAKALSFYHVPTGDLLRKEVKRTGSRYSEFIQASMDASFAVPADLMIRLILAEAKGQKWIVNGFPRNFDQLFTFEQQVCRSYSTLYLDCPTDVLRGRLRKRAVLSLRSDDEENIINKRLQAYSNEGPLQIHLQKSAPFQRVDSSGPEEEVYNLAKEGIERLLILHN
ncbi:P-loop containing nucleoside triphosphate hydrolase protein [Bisporella sp. PMI_857]|nr:P-loop containing nucleoside triphosphate hydrolase protein [Bisporella sp. PMI_857]